jgi:hypothetical protein
VVAEGAERPVARERERGSTVLLRALLVRVVGHVLAEPLVAAAFEVDRGGHPLELLVDAAAASFERVGADLERQIGDAVIERHEAADSTVPPRREDTAP